MRVVFVNPAAQLGGAELSLLDLLAAFRDHRPEDDLHLITTADGPMLAAAEAIGVTPHALPMPEAIGELGDSALRGRGKLGAAAALARRGFPAALAARGYAGRLRESLRSLRPDVIHSNGIKAHLLLRLAAPRGVPVVWHVRDFLGSRPVVARALRLSGGASGVIGISQAVARDVRAVLGRVPVRVMYDGIDTDRFSPGPGDGRRLDELAGREPIPEGTARVGLVATYARWKGQDLLIRALTKIPADLPARFYIIGGPIYQTKGSQFAPEELREMARSLGVADRLALVPFRPDTEAIYRALDVVVHASTLPEPFGRTIAEAMACARPVVVSRSGGAAELYDEGVDAVGFTTGDADSLASAIVRLLRDPEGRARIAAEARRSAEARFARERLGAELLAAYREFCGEAMGRPAPAGH